MSKFHKLKVTNIRQETNDCVSVAFDVPAHLKSDYSFIQGQYLTLKLTVNNQEIRRSYSICSSPIAETELRVAVKKVKDGLASNYLNEKLKEGDEIEVMTPMGGFYTELNESNKKNYVLFAGGSGITPMLSIIKTVLVKEPNSTLMLVYGNRDEQSVIFKNELESIEKSNSARVRVVHVLEKPSGAYPELYTGILMPIKVRSILENHVGLNLDNEFFVCGPTPMMDNVKQVLKELKINDSRIHIEYFTASLQPTEKKAATTNSALISKVTVVYDGSETKFDLATGGKSILDAAIDNDVDAPFSCKGAVCCTCRAKIISGTAVMDNNYALTDDEVAEGFILTCQAHPTSAELIVDYDQ
ncbi:MAG: 2Fe-2S iron-sulfur cluster binding domain-containing protein [Bacteroidetes bacterium]|nr:2Fe-2S iron-sulfur cluster binding domain-containing protein [Bacteroidota bacterium]